MSTAASPIRKALKSSGVAYPKAALTSTNVQPQMAAISTSSKCAFRERDTEYQCNARYALLRIAVLCVRRGFAALLLSHSAEPESAAVLSTVRSVSTEQSSL